VTKFLLTIEEGYMHLACRIEHIVLEPEPEPAPVLELGPELELERPRSLAPEPGQLAIAIAAEAFAVDIVRLLRLPNLEML